MSTPLPSPSLVPPTQNGTPTPRHLSGPVDAWTAEREARLLYVQRQLKAAQAAWSEEQELWIDELEDLKRKCLKKEKRAKGRANSVAKMWKAKTWGSAAGLKGSEGEASGESGPAFVAEPEGMVVDDGVDGDCDGEEDEE
ncbi:MAG: hypothetical protein L6R42_005572, partial [Xanthoria sp. 1 TBL-2021]